MNQQEKSEKEFRESFLQLIVFNPGLELYEEHFRFMFTRGCIHALKEVDRIQGELDRISERLDEIK